VNARLPCGATRAADRYADEEGRRTAIAMELERISEETANKLHGIIKREFGTNIWSQNLYGLAGEIAAQLMIRK